MSDSRITPAQEIAQAAFAFQQECTGHGPGSVSVLLGEGTLVVMLHDALSPAEKAAAQTPGGAERIHEFHRQLFHISAAALHLKIEQILGMQVVESTVKMETSGGSVAKAFPSGALVQVFRLSQPVATQSWSMSNRSADPAGANQVN